MLTLGYQRAKEATDKLGETGLTVEFFPYVAGSGTKRSCRPYVLIEERNDGLLKRVGNFSTVEAAIKAARDFLEGKRHERT